MLKQLPETKIVLYDHNYPSKGQEYLASHVTEIIDHHDDQTNSYPTIQNIVKNIQKAGSACTILTAMWKKQLKEQKEMEKEMAKALAMTILLDTFNFDEKLKGNRWIEEDWLMFCYLSDILKTKYAIELEKDLVFNEIANVKFNRELNLQLTLDEIMKKDCKIFQYDFGKVQYSVILVSPKDFFNNFSDGGFGQYIENLIKSEQFESIILLFAFPSDGKSLKIISREIVVYSPSEQLLKKIDNGFVEAGLKLEQIKNKSSKINNIESLHLKDLTNTYSRKIIEPIVCGLKG